jgi:hypothetical protein
MAIWAAADAVTITDGAGAAAITMDGAITAIIDTAAPGNI